MKFISSVAVSDVNCVCLCLPFLSSFPSSFSFSSSSSAVVKFFFENIHIQKNLLSYLFCLISISPSLHLSSGYAQSMSVLKHAKASKPSLITKTSLMLGLGERDEEITAALRDLRDNDVDIITFGQYLRPTKRHLSVQRFVTPEGLNKLLSLCFLCSKTYRVFFFFF